MTFSQPYTPSYSDISAPSPVSTRTLLGEAVSMAVDMDGPPYFARPTPHYPTPCQNCEQLRLANENLQRQMYEVQQNCYSLNTRLYQVEQFVFQQQQQHNVSGPLLSGRPPISHDAAQEDQHQVESLYNGFTKAQLVHDLPGKGWKGDAKWLLRRMFTFEELKGHSITGHHGASKKNGKVRPPLDDQDKLKVLYDIIMEKYPGRLITDINIVLADIVKPSAPD
ncbi:uncharacterized protein LOC134231632 [Saccostrea cucullata]|uniref:uncharacterized protein LOC134231632 n=1 Tax=Saccostrea cuccullata TaxID=36930 RepID=UPI002ED2CD0F